MGDSKEVDEEELISDGSRYSGKSFGVRSSLGLGNFPAFLGHGRVPQLLQLILFVLLAALLMATFIQVSKVPNSEELKQSQSKQETIYQELTRMKARVDHLCRPCPWDWISFQGHCYFLSNSQRNWHDSVTACQEVEAQLVSIESDEEQIFLQQTSKKKGYTWIGLSDLNQEAAWVWVDGSPLSNRLKKYWNKGQPNNNGGQDCVEFRGEGWNDSNCDNKKFWICKKSLSPCSHK
ncbi:CD209 antigen-like protein E [Dipodomys spectabilis]|uniref:CD209 antigen-like protein E n=1 Tax=Dipodomys spectabilis TaxID=105255 RepID=UPI001C542E73|nr:CD209 antigen-like protein E [Dipodomys spectabilis]